MSKNNKLIPLVMLFVSLVYFSQVWKYKIFVSNAYTTISYGFFPLLVSALLVLTSIYLFFKK